MKTFVLTIALLLEVIAVSVNAQPKIPKAPPQKDDSESEILKRIKELQVDINGDRDSPRAADDPDPGYHPYIAALTEEENEVVYALMEQIENDEATLEMVKRMKAEKADTMDAMVSGMSEHGKVMYLKNIISELQGVEILFQDPVRALVLMEEDGMIPPERLPEYKKNPQLLEDDTRKGLYFSFVTIAVALGLL